MQTSPIIAQPGLIFERSGLEPWPTTLDAAAGEARMRAALAAGRAAADFPAILDFKMKRSMLHTDPLILMREMAAVTTGAIVEFGTYIGGSTAMIAKGVRRGRTFIALEPGGAHPTHPDIPSDDILADLKVTLQMIGVEDRVKVIPVASWRPEARQQLETVLNGEKIGLWIVDSDGNIKTDFERYRDLCAEGCILFIDDYHDSGADEFHKADKITGYVDELVAAGTLVPYGVYRWGTWVGRIA